MSRLGLREIRRPNTRGASLADGLAIPAEESPTLPLVIQASVPEKDAQKSEPNPVTIGNKVATNREQTGNKLATNWQQTDNKVGTQPATSLSSSSSSIELENFKTTTTGEVELFEDGRIQLAPEWSAVDFSPLSEIGFTQTHLVQLARHGKLTALDVQESIHFFTFDLKRNEKGRELKGPPLNFFMGILRKGLPYAPPENYVSPEQEARRKFLEGKRRIEGQRLAEERELRDLEFVEWRRGITREQIADIVPGVVRDIVPARESSLKAYFDEQVWPERSQYFFGLSKLDRAEIGKQIDQSLTGATE